MADNTCHFGLNLFFADNGVEEHGKSPLYFPGEKKQVTDRAVSSDRTFGWVCFHTDFQGIYLKCNAGSQNVLR